jgi:hypothetical protein
LAGSDAVVEHDENTPPAGLTSVAQLQYGALDCEWDGLADANAPGSILDVSVAPDATAQFDRNFDAIMKNEILGQPHPTAIEGVAGDKSGYWCLASVDLLGSDENLPVCDGEMLVGSYWVSVQVSTVNDLTRTQVITGLTALLSDAATKLASAGAAPPQWPAPGTTPPALCNAKNTAAVRSIFGNTTWALGAGPTLTTNASSVGLVGVYAACRWDTPSSSGVYFGLVAGGSWSIASLKPRPPIDSGIDGAYASISVSGASQAIESCGEGECDAYLGGGTTVVEVDFPDPGTAKRSSVLGAIMKVIAAS